MQQTVNLSTDFPIRRRKGNRICNGVLRSQKWEVTLVIGVEVDFCVCKTELCGLATTHYYISFLCPLDRFFVCGLCQ